MGKKINPRIFRIRTTVRPGSVWYANNQQFKKLLVSDTLIRKFLKVKLIDGGLSQIYIERAPGQLIIILQTAKPGVIIGRGGAGIEDLKKQIKKKFFGQEKIQIQINIQEVEKPDLSAELMVQSIKAQLEKRIPFRRAMKRALESMIRAGAKGVKIIVSGRLNGAEIARREKLVDGSMPLSSLRADIDYSRGAAQTIYGKIGIKVWIYKGEVFKRSSVDSRPGSKVVALEPASSPKAAVSRPPRPKKAEKKAEIIKPKK